MKKSVSKTTAKEKVEEFFQRSNFTPEEVRKIKKLAMKHRIRLGDYRKKFCRKCHHPLKGRVKVNKGFKTVTCKECGYVNRQTF